MHRRFGSLLSCSIHNHSANVEDISNDVREAAVAALQSRQGYKADSKQFEVHHSAVRQSQVENIQDSCQSSQEWTSQQVNPKIRLSSGQRNRKEPKSCIS